MARPAREQHEIYMSQAIELAEQAARLGEVPVGALAIDDGGQVVGRAHNRRILDGDPTAHAEILALREAARHVGDWRLSQVTLYVTLEPCPMCAGALVNARVERVVFGCADPKAGAVRTLYALCEDPRLNHRVEVVAGVMAERCANLLRAFFAQLRSPRIEALGD